MSDLARLARTLNSNERTLRRAAALGLVKGERLSERRLRIPTTERRYLARHWPLITRLRAALRTEPNVELAVLFGSFARGDDASGSDVDILVALRDSDRFRMLELQDRLADALDRRVDLVRLDDAEREPWLLAEILGEGRVLVDRGDRWSSMVDQASLMRRRGERELDERARAVLRRVRARSR